MSGTGDALNRYLSTVRRIEEHREQSAVKELKKLYRQLMKEISERVAESYARYADPETGAIDYAVLHRDGMDARLLEEIMRSTGIASLEECRIIEQLAKESYAKCYDGMVSAVQRAATDDALQESLQTIRAVAPEVIAEAVHNPVSGLTLADRLEKKRGEIIYGIKQSVGVGLSQGDRYDTMTRRIAETLAGADGAGGYYGKAVRIARTEAHRVREAGNSDAATVLQEKAALAGYQMLKRWNTMKDERVRPNRRYKTKHGWKSGKPGFYNHAAMDGVEIPLDEDFKLPSGASGPAPGRTNVAGEDINCRCFLTYRMEKTTRVLDGGDRLEREQQREGRNKATAINHEYIKSGEYRRKFDRITDNPAVNRVLYQKSKEILAHRSGTKFEDMYWINADTGEVVASVLNEAQEERITYSKALIQKIKGQSRLITIHNHPGSMPPSIDDFNSNFRNGYLQGLVVCHDGTVYRYSSEEYVSPVLYKMYMGKYNKLGKQASDVQNMALLELCENRSMTFEVVR